MSVPRSKNLYSENVSQIQIGGHSKCRTTQNIQINLMMDPVHYGRSYKDFLILGKSKESQAFI